MPIRHRTSGSSRPPAGDLPPHAQSEIGTYRTASCQRVAPNEVTPNEAAGADIQVRACTDELTHKEDDVRIELNGRTINAVDTSENLYIPELMSAVEVLRDKENVASLHECGTELCHGIAAINTYNVPGVQRGQSPVYQVLMEVGFDHDRQSKAALVHKVSDFEYELVWR